MTSIIRGVGKWAWLKPVLVATPLVKIKNECVVIDVFFSSLSIVLFFLFKKTAKSLMWNPVGPD